MATISAIFPYFSRNNNRSDDLISTVNTWQQLNACATCR